VRFPEVSAGSSELRPQVGNRVQPNEVRPPTDIEEENLDDPNENVDVLGNENHVLFCEPFGRIELALVVDHFERLVRVVNTCP
jgi:hypothetical protein